MNEQYPTQDSASPSTDSSIASAYPGYAHNGTPKDSLPALEHLVGLPNPESSFLAQETQEIAQMNMPPVAQPLQASDLLGGLGSLAAHDRWDENYREGVEALSPDSNEASAPLSALPLPSFAAPEPFDTAQRLTAPFSLPTLPNLSFPAAPISIPQPMGVPQTHSAELPTDIAPPPPVFTGWDSPATLPDPGANSVTASVAEHSQLPCAPSVPGLTMQPTFAVEPASVAPSLLTQSFLAPPLPASAIPPAPAFPVTPAPFDAPAFPTAAAIPPAPAFPVTLPAFEAPAFPAVSTFQDATFSPTPSDPEPRLAADEQPFDAGDSFGPLDLNRTHASVQVHTDPFEGGVDFSSNPLPRPEALVMRELEQPEKTSRFGHKQKAPVDLLSAGQGSSSLSPEIAVDKKAKRFGKKPVQTVDLLGAPIAARVIDASDTTQTSPAQSLSVEETPEGKAKRKLFARVDRTKEKPLGPTNGRARKIIQGLAAVSLLAGAGLFTLSFLDKKSTNMPVEPTVETPIATAPAVDPTVSTIAPAQVDPATGLPIPGLGDTGATPGNSDVASPTSTPQSVPTVVAPLDATPTPIDSIPGSLGEPATPGPDAQASATTIAPGPDDLEFSTGGNFSEG